MAHFASRSKLVFLLTAIFVGSSQPLFSAGQYENVHVDRVDISADDSKLVFGTEFGVHIFNILDGSFETVRSVRFGAPSFLDQTADVILVDEGSLELGQGTKTTIEKIVNGITSAVLPTSRRASLPLLLPGTERVVYVKKIEPDEEDGIVSYTHGIYWNAISGGTETLLWMKPNYFVRSYAPTQSGRSLLVYAHSIWEDRSIFFSLDLESKQYRELDLANLHFSGERRGSISTVYGEIAAGVDERGVGFLGVEYADSHPGELNTDLRLFLVDQEGRREDLIRFSFGPESRSGFSYLEGIYGSVLTGVFVLHIETLGTDYRSHVSRLYLLDLNRNRFLRLMLHEVDGVLSSSTKSVELLRR